MAIPTKASLTDQLASEVERVSEVGQDESMSREVERILHGSSHSGLRRVQCRFVDGSVTLSGEVVSYYLKQIAQTIVGRLPQVSRVHNQLRVVSFCQRRVDR